MTLPSPQPFAPNEPISALKYNMMRNIVALTGQQLNAFSVEMPKTPFRLASSASHFFPISETIETNEQAGFANVSSFVATGRHIVLSGALYNITTGSFIYSSPMSWVTIRPNSGTSTVLLWSDTIVSVFFHVSSAGALSFTRTGTSNRFGFSGVCFAGV